MNANVNQRINETHPTRRHLGTLAALALTACTLVVHAQVDTIWTNDTGDNQWGTAGNWTNGIPTGNANLNAIFGPDPSIGNPDVGGTRQFQNLVFQSAGWTLGGGTVYAYKVESSGNGVNTIGVFRPNGTTDAWRDIDVAADNTLVISDQLLQYGTLLDKTGDGTLVVSGANKTGNRKFDVTGGTMLLNTGTQAMRHGIDGNVRVSAMLGGVGSISMSHGKRLDIKSGGILAPGGLGGFGNPLGTFTYDASSATDPGGNLRMESGSTLRIRIGDAPGVNSQLVLGSVGEPALELQPNVALELIGDWDTLRRGEYVIATFPSWVGSEFASVTFNGSTSWVTGITYADTSISVGLIPEPTSLALLALGGLALLKRRR